LDEIGKEFEEREQREIMVFHKRGFWLPPRQIDPD